MLVGPRHRQHRRLRHRRGRAALRRGPQDRRGRDQPCQREDGARGRHPAPADGRRRRPRSRHRRRRRDRSFAPRDQGRGRRDAAREDRRCGRAPDDRDRRRLQAGRQARCGAAAGRGPAARAGLRRGQDRRDRRAADRAGQRRRAVSHRSGQHRPRLPLRPDRRSRVARPAPVGDSPACSGTACSSTRSTRFISPMGASSKESSGPSSQRRKSRAAIGPVRPSARCVGNP